MRCSAKVKLCVLMLLLILTTVSTAPQTASKEVKNRVLIVLAPELDIDLINNATAFASIINSSSILTVEAKQPFNRLFYELLVVNGTVKTTVPQNELWNALDYERLNKLWNVNDTVFVNFAVLDPNKYNATINPAFNITNDYIEADVIVVNVNENTTWRSINVSITVARVNETFKITLAGSGVYRDYKDIRFSNNVTDQFMINLTEHSGLKPGFYYVKFRIISYNDTHVKLLFPGARIRDGWLSKVFGLFLNPVYPYSLTGIKPLLNELENDDLEWVLNETINYYSSLLDLAMRHRNATVFFFDIPLFEEIRDISLAKGVDLRRQSLKLIENIATMIQTRGFNLILYAPYVNSTLHNTRGLLLIYPSYKPLRDLYITVENVVGYLMSFSDQYGLGLKNLLVELTKLKSRYDEADAEIRRLKSEIFNLNKTVADLRGSLDSEIARNLELRSRLDDLNKTIEGYRVRESEIKLFLLAGVLSIIVLNIVLYSIGTRIILKKEK